MMPVLDRQGGVVAARVVEARSFGTRLRGWMGRVAIDDGEALYLPGCASVHTFFMKVPIDVAFTGRDGTVLSVRANLAPWRIAVHPGAWGVVELAAGRAASAGIIAGSRLSVMSGDVA